MIHGARLKVIMSSVWRSHCMVVENYPAVILLLSKVRIKNNVHSFTSNFPECYCFFTITDETDLMPRKWQWIRLTGPVLSSHLSLLSKVKQVTMNCLIIIYICHTCPARAMSRIIGIREEHEDPWMKTIISMPNVGRNTNRRKF